MDINNDDNSGHNDIDNNNYGDNDKTYSIWVNKKHLDVLKKYNMCQSISDMNMFNDTFI